MSERTQSDLASARRHLEMANLDVLSAQQSLNDAMAARNEWIDTVAKCEKAHQVSLQYQEEAG